MIVPYIHAGGKIGVLVAVSGADRSNAAVAALAKDLAMQVAAANPSYVGRNDVPAPVIEHEKTIYREQAKASGKPDKILDKIADGKLEKYFGDFCLVEQAFIKDPDRKVSQLLADAGKAAGAADRGARLRPVPGGRGDGEAVGRPGRRGGEAARAGVIDPTRRPAEVAWRNRRTAGSS